MADNNYFGSLSDTEAKERSSVRKRKESKKQAASDSEGVTSPSLRKRERKKSGKDQKKQPKVAKKDSGKSSSSQARWFSANPSKRWGELFFLYYTPVWISFFVIIVLFKIYERCGNYGYTAIGLTIALPCFLIPLIFPGEFDRKLPITQRYWFKANIWIAVISFIGNYFWTHYFYVVLKTSYTFPTTWDLNNVPIYLYLITHAYFHTYHNLSNLVLRRVRTGRLYTALHFDWLKLIVNTAVIGGFSMSIAFMEAFSISSVPYYSYPDAFMMYTVGSVFYGIYFYISFPMFFRLDEDAHNNTHNNNTHNKHYGWTVAQTFIDALAACMLVTIILDLWRLALGPIIQGLGGRGLIADGSGTATHGGVPFVY